MEMIWSMIAAPGVMELLWSLIVWPAVLMVLGLLLFRSAEGDDVDLGDSDGGGGD
jgi:hypothetical protein